MFLSTCMCRATVAPGSRAQSIFQQCWLQFLRHKYAWIWCRTKAWGIVCAEWPKIWSSTCEAVWRGLQSQSHGNATVDPSWRGLRSTSQSRESVTAMAVDYLCDKSHQYTLGSRLLGSSLINNMGSSSMKTLGMLRSSRKRQPRSST